MDTPETRASQAIPADGLLNRHQVAAFLGISIPTLKRMLADRDAPQAIRLGRLLRWRREEVEAWCKRKEQRARKAHRAAMR